MKKYLFSYGTLQKDNVQLELFGRLLTGERDILRGHKTSRVEIKDASFLSKGEGKHQLTLTISNDETDAVEGTVFKLLEEELLQADEYEPDGYERVEVILNSGKRAWIYRMAE